MLGHILLQAEADLPRNLAEGRQGLPEQYFASDNGNQ